MAKQLAYSKSNANKPSLSHLDSNISRVHLRGGCQHILESIQKSFSAVLEQKVILERFSTQSLCLATVCEIQVK